VLRNAEDVFTKLQRVEVLAKQDAKIKFTSLAHLMTPELLQNALKRLNKHGAPGVDGVTVQEFAHKAKANTDALHLELKEMKYRASNVRRVQIPKSNGKLRPLGIPTVRDRVVQLAMATVLQAVYEPSFLDVSYGFRPGRSAHDAIEAVKMAVDRTPINWIVDVDIKAYFDHVNHKWMIKFLEHRIADRTMLRLVSKCLNAGVMDNGVVTRSDEGTPQGGPISPLLANIYLHYVLDLWFEKRYKPQRLGQCFMVRYADDFVVGFEREDEAKQFLLDLEQRLAEFGLEIATEKTQIIRFGRNWGNGVGNQGKAGEPTGTFNFLGFTHYMKQRGDGTKRRPMVARKPKKESRNKFLRAVKEWLWKCMHTSVRWQKKQLTIKLKGYYGYFGLRHCLAALQHIKFHVERLWITTLRRRSQRHNLHWTTVRKRSWFNLPEPCLRS
jgi:RNA-directed DNA polymerase